MKAKEYAELYRERYNQEESNLNASVHTVTMFIRNEWEAWIKKLDMEKLPRDSVMISKVAQLHQQWKAIVRYLGDDIPQVYKDSFERVMHDHYPLAWTEYTASIHYRS